MRHYIDLRLRPDPEIAAHQLMSAVFGRLHLALVQAARQDVGVSFPEHDERRPSLGSVLRLHGSEQALVALHTTGWLRHLNDYATVQPIAAVPAGCGHRVVSRVQAKSGVDRLRRRAMRRHGYDAAEAARRIPATAQELLALPFVTIGSRSTGQAAFPLFVRHGPVLPEAVSGVFNSYGLSTEATVPWF
jgi:CRISPR-associated endonuclease Csy4